MRERQTDRQRQRETDRDREKRREMERVNSEEMAESRWKGRRNGGGGGGGYKVKGVRWMNAGSRRKAVCPRHYSNLYLI